MIKQTFIAFVIVCVLAGVRNMAWRDHRPFFTNANLLEATQNAQAPNHFEASAKTAAIIPSAATAIATPISPEPKTRQHVFRLQLDRGGCSLEKLEEVSGSFERERVPKWQAGMLCCRLIAGDGRIVGERTLHAPDYVCVVLDPNSESKAPTAARLTSDGSVTFQVRFPQIADAVRLEVHRIATDARPADAATPVGPLIASIAILSK